MLRVRFSYGGNTKKHSSCSNTYLFVLYLSYSLCTYKPCALPSFPTTNSDKKATIFFSSPDAEGVTGRCLPRAASDAVRFLFFSDSADRQYQDYRSRRVFGDHLRVSRHLGGGTKDAVPFSPTFHLSTPREKCPVYFFSGSRNSLDNTYRVCCAKQPRRNRNPSFRLMSVSQHESSTPLEIFF